MRWAITKRKPAPKRIIRPRASSSFGWRPFIEELEPRAVPALLTAGQIDGAIPVPLHDSGATLWTADIAVAYERDLYCVDIPGEAGVDAARLLRVTQRASTESELDTLLSGYNAAGMLLANSDDEAALGADSLDSELELLVVPGRSYYFEAAGAYVTTGDYELRFELGQALDDFPDTHAQAHTLALEDALLDSIVGRIDPQGDIDVFRFVAPQDGQAEITVTSIPAESTADGLLSRMTVLDSHGNVPPGRRGGRSQAPTIRPVGDRGRCGLFRGSQRG